MRLSARDTPTFLGCSCLVQRETKIFLRSLSSETARLTRLNMDDCGVDEGQCSLGLVVMCYYVHPTYVRVKATQEFWLGVARHFSLNSGLLEWPKPL